MDAFIIVANKDEKIIFTSESELETIRAIQLIWSADGDADLYKLVPRSSSEGK